jgi:hypothetical protein
MPIKPVFVPWALKHYKKFLCKSHQHPSFKTQGGKNLFLLERARKAVKQGFYDQEWLIKKED